MYEECQLCCEELESIGHLFFICRNTRWVLERGFNAFGGIIKLDVNTSFDGLFSKLKSHTEIVHLWPVCTGPFFPSPTRVVEIEKCMGQAMEFDT